jgi:hypothetical protein
MPLSFNPSTFARTQKSTFENYTTAFTNQLAAHLDSAIVIAAVDVLQQVRHFGKGTPFSIRGNVFFPFAAVLRNVPYGFHNSKSTGYNGGIQRKKCRNSSYISG